MLDLIALTKMSDADLAALCHEKPDEWNAMLSQLVTGAEDDMQACQLAYYQLANPMALPIHTSLAREICAVGGNRSTKTDTILAELAIQMTNHVPKSLEAIYPREKLRGPIRARIVCNSLTDVLEPIIKPKLRWDHWNGEGDPKGGRGHWGWMPRHCLKGGTWENAYSEKFRTLHVSVDSFWAGPHGIERMTGTSSCQFLSYDQDISAFTGASLHFIGHDEVPRADIYRENRMRTLDVRGRMYTGFTPPDQIGTNRADVAWFYDQVYEQGLPGPNKNPGIESIILHTEKNRIMSAQDIADYTASMTDEERDVRLHGKFLHLAGVVYSLFSQYEATWCFACSKRVVPVDGRCVTCAGDNVVGFSHVIEPFPIPTSWPVIFVIDPHPRKKDACGWFAISPSDDVYMIGELETDGTAIEVVKAIKAWETDHRVMPVKRLMDPNIATETNDKLGRGWTMRKAYDDAGLRCDLANDEVNAGIDNVNVWLKPDPRTRKPMFQTFRSNARFIHGMTHWSWDEWTRQGDREPKEKVRDKAKDFPDLVRYLANGRPTFHGLTRSAPPHRPMARSARGY